MEPPKDRWGSGRSLAAVLWYTVREASSAERTVRRVSRAVSVSGSRGGGVFSVELLLEAKEGSVKFFSFCILLIGPGESRRRAKAKVRAGPNQSGGPVGLLGCVGGAG